MKITRTAQINKNELLAKKAGVSSGSSAAWAAKLNTPRPKSAKGTQASHTRVRLLLKPLILRISIIGASVRLAS
ncbi:hypothetical protein [Cyanobium usitatum]|uniref:hypothetical protein n=1 Tax=Cyanobium usitatum TaxID=2304190 RepID=UPI002AD3B9C3|nr:hypothetical protein [Cyanobium usitatum]